MADLVKVLGIRQTLMEMRKRLCPGCDEEFFQANQLGHMTHCGVGCLDSIEDIDEGIYNDACRQFKENSFIASVVDDVLAKCNAFPPLEYKTMNNEEIREIVLGLKKWNIEICEIAHVIRNILKNMTMQ